jgi:hypothetical protein
MHPGVSDMLLLPGTRATAKEFIDALTEEMIAQALAQFERRLRQAVAPALTVTLERRLNSVLNRDEILTEVKISIGPKEVV